jgi:hypothetical protein
MFMGTRDVQPGSEATDFINVRIPGDPSTDSSAIATPETAL